MKNYKQYIVTLFLLFLAVPQAEAQYRNGQYGRRNTVPQAEEPARKIEPKTATEIVEEQMPKINNALELNEFEKAVVSTILTKYVQQGIELQLLALSPDKTREGLEKIKKNQDEELKAGLSEEKYTALIALQKDGFRKTKAKKRKKKKTKS